MASVGFLRFVLMGILFQMVVADISKEYKESLDSDIQIISEFVSYIQNTVSKSSGLSESEIMPSDGVSWNIRSQYNGITSTTVNLKEFLDLTESVSPIENMKPTALDSTLKNRIQEYSSKLKKMVPELSTRNKTDKYGHCKAYWKAQDDFYAHSVGIVLTDIQYFAVLKASYQFANIKDANEKKIQSLGKEHEQRVKGYMKDLLRTRRSIPEEFQICEDLIRQPTEMSKLIYKLNMFYVNHNYLGSFPKA